MRSKSINGTGMFAGMFRAEGHEVRSAVRLSDELRGWADVIVRFSPDPGLPPLDEANWYESWLDARPDRRLIYVPRDYDAIEEYWTRALLGVPQSAKRLRERVEEARTTASLKETPSSKPAKASKFVKPTVFPTDWFDVESTEEIATCQTLTGSWASGIDPAKAALSRRHVMKEGMNDVLLWGDKKPLVLTWERISGSRVLAIASGVFLLNLPLVEPARWPLAARTLAWAVESDDGTRKPRRVAFVEGLNVMTDRAAPRSVFELLAVDPFGRVACQFLALGLAACLARATQLGRPRSEEPSESDRPVAHPEALGALLARTGQAREARTILETYRRWRVGPPTRSPASRSFE